jgi:hypothetical protein
VDRRGREHEHVPDVVAGQEVAERPWEPRYLSKFMKNTTLQLCVEKKKVLKKSDYVYTYTRRVRLRDGVGEESRANQVHGPSERGEELRSGQAGPPRLRPWESGHARKLHHKFALELFCECLCPGLLFLPERNWTMGTSP